MLRTVNSARYAMKPRKRITLPYAYIDGVSLCSNILYNSSVKVCTVVGFPHGRTTLASKHAEVLEACERGAAGVDIVLNYAALRTGEKSLAAEEAVQLCQAARDHGLLTKIIVETCYLNRQQKLTALKICEQADADFIKTSTGFGSAGACIEDIELFRDHRIKGIHIKASGGIRDLKTARAMIDAGATRLGVSAAAAILAEFKGDESIAQADSSY